MAIARNKPKTPADREAAIAAFAAEADAVEPAKPAPTRQAAAAAPAAAAGEGAKSNVIRWGGEEDLRDRLNAYSTAERYSLQEVMIKALRIGIDQLEAER